MLLFFFFFKLLKVAYTFESIVNVQFDGFTLNCWNIKDTHGCGAKKKKNERERGGGGRRKFYDTLRTCNTQWPQAKTRCTYLNSASRFPVSLQKLVSGKRNHNARIVECPVIHFGCPVNHSIRLPYLVNAHVLFLFVYLYGGDDNVL